MITSELYMTRDDGVKLYLTKSDTYTIINEDGVEYNEAVDVEGHGHTYTETTNYREDYEGEKEMNTNTFYNETLNEGGGVLTTLSEAPASVVCYDEDGEMIDVKWTYINGTLRYDVEHTVTGCTIKVIP